MFNTISECCKNLKLSKTIVENSSKIKAETHEDFLLQLLNKEIENRRKLRVQTLIKQAGFQVLKTLKGYDFSQIKFPATFLEPDIQTGSFITEKQNIIMYGNVGTGKTHLATAIGI